MPSSKSSPRIETTPNGDIIDITRNPTTARNNLYKTELCKHFMEYGNCRYNNKCQFAHGKHELRGVLRHPKYKTTRCKVFAEKGFCQYKNRCRFIHSTSTSDDDSSVEEEEKVESEEAEVSTEEEQRATTPPPAAKKSFQPRIGPPGMMLTRSVSTSEYDLETKRGIKVTPEHLKEMISPIVTGSSTSSSSPGLISRASQPNLLPGASSSPKLYMPPPALQRSLSGIDYSVFSNEQSKFLSSEISSSNGSFSDNDLGLFGSATSSFGASSVAPLNSLTSFGTVLSSDDDNESEGLDEALSSLSILKRICSNEYVDNDLHQVANTTPYSEAPY